MKPETPQIGFVSLGCPKNLVDSERILTQLRAEGYALSDSYEQADLVVVNTCGFIDAAVEESLDTIGEALAANGKVIVTGCLGAREETIREAHPQVLAVSGAHEYEAVMRAVHTHLPPPAHPGRRELPPQGVKLTPRHYAYLKIAEGCNHHCSFCIIPAMRGDLVSRSFDQVMLEAKRLAESGVRELLVVSQDTGAWGQDIRHRNAFWQGRAVRSDLPELASALGELGIWVRLHYLYPYQSLDKLLPLMAEGKILPYMDIPMQHANNRILRAMRRPAASERLLDRITGWRAQVPELTLRSTFIVGFPGETEEDFEELLAFLAEAKLDRVGCFAYSDVEGAESSHLPDKVDLEVAEERRQRLMELQQEISAERLAKRIGKREIVLVDEVHSDHVVARSAGDAPEIDGLVLIEGGWDLEPGDFVEVEYEGSDEHDLHARMASPIEE